MDESLFFWLIIIAVAVLQGIGQKKKKAGRPGPRQPPGSQGEPRTPPREQGRVQASARLPTAPPGPGGGPKGERSSESMVPEDVWAEILGLARGEPRRVEPDPSPPSEEEPVPWALEERPRKEKPAAARARRVDLPVPEERPFPASHGADAPLHQTKPNEYGARLAVSQAPDAEAERGKGRGVRGRVFGAGSVEELRKAVILREVLGPPLSLREEGE